MERGCDFILIKLACFSHFTGSLLKILGGKKDSEEIDAGSLLPLRAGFLPPWAYGQRVNYIPFGETIVHKLR